MRLALDIIGMVMTSVIMIMCGLVFYAARDYLERAHNYAFGKAVSLYLALIWSYFLCFDFGFGKGLSGALIHVLMVIGMWLFYCYLFRCSFRMAKFLSTDREDYSLSRYFRWRRVHMKYERIKNDAISYKEPAYTVMLYSILIGVSAFMFSLIFIYVPSDIVSSNFAVDDPIEHCTVYVSRDVQFYDGLPASDHQIIWTSNESIVLSDVKVSLITDRGNVNCKYWQISYSSLSDNEKKSFPKRSVQTMD